jgi:hypothetical protein
MMTAVLCEKLAQSRSPSRLLIKFKDTVLEFSLVTYHFYFFHLNLIVLLTKILPFFL